MPEYFEGASDIYYNDAEVMGWRFKNKYKFPVSEKVKNIVRANFTNFTLKQRLQDQYDQKSLVSSK